eukprot:CAMPEP_0117527590 /NCGR_PEP_ID=MMETSP0784-20121206/36877_1 /TAXON_ID=39447 /ORGANISM="" /LENGTH=667 /DNA_ID=CAMNT_0005323849 /DNA_START=28 /DNA_END=2028 /DNA_ORIENTATION=+
MAVFLGIAGLAAGVVAGDSFAEKFEPPHDKVLFNAELGNPSPQDRSFRWLPEIPLLGLGPPREQEKVLPASIACDHSPAHLPSWATAALAFSIFVTTFAIVASTQALLRWDTIHWPWSRVKCCGSRLPAIWDPSSLATVKLQYNALARRELALLEKFRAIFGGPLNEEGVSWHEHSKRMRSLLTGEYLALGSITSSEGMLDFFAGHRVLARQDCLQTCLGIRMTVHYNLFCGSILALGSEDQQQWLHGAHSQGLLGCFMLTEVGAGVLSGLVVEATATWEWSGAPGEGHFDLHTPTPAAEKTWISQGLAADWGIVVAQLVVEGKSHGPHVFLLDMTADGVSRECMGQKTSFNALDNARVRFDHVKLPRRALLSKFCSVELRRCDDGPDCEFRAEYKYVGSRPPSFVLIAQRLLTGRLCISDSAIAYLEGVLAATREYAEGRMVWIDKERKMPLATLPYMEKVFRTVDAGANVHKAYLLLLQMQLAEAIEEGVEPSRDLVTRIAAAKVEAVEFAIKSSGLLRRDVGAYGLMAGSPFGSDNDVLLCARFAEGDSRVLQQMLSRDLLRGHSSPRALMHLVCRAIKAWLQGDLHTTSKLKYLRDSKLLRLMWVLRQHVRNATRISKVQAQTDAWLQAGDLVYDVAKTHAQYLIHSTIEQHFGRSRDTDRFL